MKKILLNYEFKMFVPFGLGEYKTIYVLTLLKTYFFGLIKKTVKFDYTISMFGTIQDYKDNWDELIKNKKSFK